MALTDKPLIYIVIRYHNAYDLTKVCIDSLSSCTYENLKFLIVDDSSSDESASRLCDDFNSKVNISSIKMDRYSDYCISLNKGMHYALDDGAEFIFVVNNDTKSFSINYFEKLLELFYLDSNIAIVGSKVYDYDGEVRSDAKPILRLGTIIPIPTEGYMFSRLAIKKLGFFDEKLVRHMEDFDYVIRCEQMGLKCLSTNEVSFDHLGGGTSRYQLFYPHFYRMRNVIWFMKKYREGWNIFTKIKFAIGYFKHHLIKARSSIKSGYYFTGITQVLSAILGTIAGTLTKW